MRVLNRNNVTLFVHFFCWLIFAVGVLYYHPSTWNTPVPGSFWIKQTILLAILIIVFYLNFSLLIPRLLIRKKISIYIAFVVVLLALVYFLNVIINNSLNLNDLIFSHQEHGQIDINRHRGRF